ncbi:hypothetical protein [Streptomyces sp. NPDC058757]|uniref:hypothetical protein n=1 Tax=unclassified Streptomyces TaxID=2593676 RepID=UPI00368472E2
MRTWWACGLVLGMIGLVGCSGTAEDPQEAAPTATPSVARLAISGAITVLLSTDGKGPDVGKPCAPPAGSKVKAGAEVRVTDSEGKTLGTQKLGAGHADGSMLKTCNFSFSFKVPGAAENYEMSVEGFPPMRYTREDIRRGLSFYETEQGTLAPQ